MALLIGVVSDLKPAAVEILVGDAKKEVSGAVKCATNRGMNGGAGGIIRCNWPGVTVIAAVCRAGHEPSVRTWHESCLFYIYE
jgi:hypothetical protein